MSHPSKLKILQQAKLAGYQVELVFIATSDFQTNINRVRQRVKAGGHDVPSDKIMERYHRSIGLLPAAAEIAHRVTIYDNTSLPQQAAIIENGELVFIANNIPKWAENVVREISDRTQERNHIENNTNILKLALIPANIDNGKYQGAIQSISNNYLTQFLDSNQIVLHDRSIVKIEHALEENFRIAYEDGNVAATFLPTSKNKQWAETILPIAQAVFQEKRDLGEVKTASRGIEIAECFSYNLLLNRNTETLTIINSKGNNPIATYDLTCCTTLDLQQWKLKL